MGIITQMKPQTRLRVITLDADSDVDIITQMIPRGHNEMWGFIVSHPLQTCLSRNMHGPDMDNAT